MRKLVRLSDTYLCITVAVFSILSKIIFEKVYSASEIVVDEEFHLALGKAYCNFDYHLVRLNDVYTIVSYADFLFSGIQKLRPFQDCI